jgi:hypothetical protein
VVVVICGPDDGVGEGKDIPDCHVENESCGSDGLEAEVVVEGDDKKEYGGGGEDRKENGL